MPRPCPHWASLADNVARHAPLGDAVVTGHILTHVNDFRAILVTGPFGDVVD